jgi:hypothetical protein
MPTILSGAIPADRQEHDDPEEASRGLRIQAVNAARESITFSVQKLGDAY